MHIHQTQQCISCQSIELRFAPAILMPFVSHRALGWQPVEIDASWQLQTIAPGHAYALCRSVYCPACDMLFLDIRFDDAQMAALYAGYRDEDYTTLREHYEPGYRLRNNRFSRPLPYLANTEQFIRQFGPAPLSVLDWGGDTGMNTPFRNSADSVHIFDISQKDTLPGVKRIQASDQLAAAYDLIACCHVLEHLPDPGRTLREIMQHMQAQTRLFVEVPFEAVMRQGHARPEQHKRHWHEHVNCFSLQALNRLLASCGLRVRASRVHETHNPGDQPLVLQALCQLA